jgi:hypothetical protein
MCDTVNYHCHLKQLLTYSWLKVLDLVQRKELPSVESIPEQHLKS